MELKRKAISSVKWVSTATLVSNGLQFLLVVILTRFLSKADFGLMALVQVVIEFSSFFIDMGFSNIIIHKQDITHRQLSSLYWLNIFAGIIICAIVFILSPVISSFYNKPQLDSLLKLASLTFLIIPFGQQHKTLLQKELKFDTITKIDVVSRAVSFIVAVALGVSGFGVYALIWMVIINSLISTILFLYVGLKTNKPEFIFSHSELKGVYSFGLFQLSERTLNYFSGQFDTIIIGKILGIESLGIYSIAKNLVMRPAQMVNPIITRVTFPIMSKVQSEITLLKKSYISTTNYLGSINFPVHLGIWVLAEPLTILLFGTQWNTAVPIVRILSIFAMIRSIFNPIGSLLLAKGRADLGFYWVVAFSIISPPIIYLGSLWGLKGVSYAQIILYLFLFYPFYKILIQKLIEANFWEYHKAIVIPFLISAAATLIPFVLNEFLKGYSLRISSVIISGSILYFLLSYKFNRDFINTLRSFI